MLAPLVVAPGQDDADVSGHAAWKIDDLVKNAIAPRFQIVRPELVNFARDSRECFLPARLTLIDGATAIGAERVGKAVDLHLAEAIAHCTLDHGGGELD